MKVKIARTSGFCMGVRKAVNLTLDAARDRSQPITTLGPLIHNPQVVEMLEKRGVAKLPIFGGGIVPEEDKAALLEAGIAEIFTPGTTTTDIVEWIEEHIRPQVAS